MLYCIYSFYLTFGCSNATDDGFFHCLWTTCSRERRGMRYYRYESALTAKRSCVMRIQYYYFRKALTDIESKGNPNPKLKIQLCVKQSYNSAFLAEDGKD